MRRDQNSRSSFAVAAIGALLPPDYLQSVASLEAPCQQGSDYGLTKSFTIKDEISRYWRIACDLYARREERLAAGRGRPETIYRREWTIPFLETVLGYTLTPSEPVLLDDRALPLSHTAFGGEIPVLVASPGKKPDEADRSFGEKGRKRSASGLIQELLNGVKDWTWGVFCNGHILRLHRENRSLTRSAFIEADLETIFKEQLYSEFALLWLLFHSSRLDPERGTEGKCILEVWRSVSREEGERALERLRHGVKEALIELGSGFLAFPANSVLRARLAEGSLTAAAFFEELLRLVYRLLFLFSAEDRQLLFDPEAGPEQKKLYMEGYSLGRLRERALRRRSRDRYPDLWRGLTLLFECLEKGTPALGLAPLGGLFSPEHCPNLDDADISNASLLEAVRRLTFFKTSSGLARVNYRDMGTEELGSVYEALLELHPFIDVNASPWTFSFPGEDGIRGSARRLSGSYYTPASLVDEMIRSALDPAVARALKDAKNPREALLSLKVVDPACGSGHFLLAAARKLSAELARIDSGSDSPDELSRQKAFREVVRNCIFGVDRNPMAVELCKTALWIESLEPGKPLTFLDPHIQCGDSLLGVLDPLMMKDGIPDGAYKRLDGDEGPVCSALRKKNRGEVESSHTSLFVGYDSGLSVSRVGANSGYFHLPEDDLDQVREKKRRWKESLLSPEAVRRKLEADLYVSAFFIPKTEETFESVPTTEDLLSARDRGVVRQKVKAAAERVAERYKFFHWPLAFPDAMEAGGFDVVLGNPPWERIKLQEQEFFSPRSPWIAGAPNAAERKRRIKALIKPDASAADKKLAHEFAEALRDAGRTGSFLRAGGRFPLSAVGDVNTYALFAETMTQLSGRGRAGFIVPSGIASDSSTSAFFKHLVSDRRLESLYDFENREKLFPDVDSRQRFSLLTLARDVESPVFVFFAANAGHLADERRCFTLSPEDFRRINPNTGTAPTFRSNADAGLTKKIYDTVPVLIDDTKGAEGNPWGLSFTRLFDMSNDSGLFRTYGQLDEAGAIREGLHWLDEEGVEWTPLWEAKMIHQYDHRWATYEPDGKTSRDCTSKEKKNPLYEPLPRYWVPRGEVARRLKDKGWSREWLMGWRDICRSTDERTVISNVVPRAGCGDTFLIMLPDENNFFYNTALIGCLNSIVLDYFARQKVGGTHLKYNVFKQLPVLSPSVFSKSDLQIIIPRLIELIYTSSAMAPFAKDLGFDGPPFPWDEERRAHLRAELDAYYAMLYGLTRDELRYILDPILVKGEDYPSETFRVLKNNEIRRFGEYRTARLVLQAWDRLEGREWQDS